LSVVAGRKVTFRVAAVLVGLMPLVAAEGAFRLLDWGHADVHDDPFVGFHAVYPLFEPNADGSRYEVARSRLGYFRPDSFAAHKPPGEFRIFCLGGSTVQGRPFAIETAFSTWLEISLQAAEPTRTWEVVNCGGVSYASYRLVPILEEVLQYEPDLIILYTGHNEFLEDRTYAHIKHLPTAVAWPLEKAAQTRSFVLLNQACRRLRGDATGDPPRGRPILESEVDAMLEHEGGLGQYRRDPEWRQDTIEHFRYNLRRMVTLAREAGVPILLVNPVSNLRDCPPFKSEHRAGLTAEDLARWQSLVDDASGYRGVDLPKAPSRLQQALAIDDQYAGLHYLVARCCDDLGMMDEARAAYLQAKELDVCPLRIIEPINEAVLETAASTSEAGTMLVDVRKYYEDHSEGGIPGNYLLVDHVHPSIAGHQQIANLLAEELIRRGFLKPGADWPQTRDRRYAEHLESLDDLYFAKGQERLEMLRRWTHGGAGRARGRQ
jgi:lysophospholipase L1-like esterase